MKSNFKFISNYSRHIIYLSLILIMLIIVSQYSNHIEIYDTKWFYASTPIGLIHALLEIDDELTNWFQYLLDSEPVKTNSDLNLSLSFLIILFSSVFIFLMRKEVQNRC